MAKFTVSEFLKRMTERFWKRGYEFCLRGIRFFLIATFVAVLISTLAECRPFSHHWQVVPDPGPQCRQGYAHLLTMGITDMITDILLIVFPIPIILCSSMPMKRKLSLVALFSMSIVLIVITGARVPLVIERRGIQQFRTVLASSEILAAAIVSNAIILGSFLRDRGVKKAKYKVGSTTDSMDRRNSARNPTLHKLASDEDLARSLGYRPNPELSEIKTVVPKPAPVADIGRLSPTKPPRPFSGSSWQFPNQNAVISQHGADSIFRPRSVEEPLPSPRGGRRVSFFDVGGLLEDGSNASTAPSLSDSVAAHDFAIPRPRRASRASNSSLANGRNRRSSRLSQQSEDYELSPRLAQQLQDLRGFLSESHEIDEPDQPSSHAPVNTSQPMQTMHTSATRSPTRPRFGSLPSITDAGGLLSSSPCNPSR